MKPWRENHHKAGCESLHDILLVQLGSNESCKIKNDQQDIVDIKKMREKWNWQEKVRNLSLEKRILKMSRESEKHTTWESESENDKKRTTCHLRNATGLVLPKSSASTPKEGGELTTSYVNPACWVERLCSLRVYNWWNTNGKSHFLTDFLSLHSRCRDCWLCTWDRHVVDDDAEDKDNFTGGNPKPAGFLKKKKDHKIQNEDLSKVRLRNLYW